MDFFVKIIIILLSSLAYASPIIITAMGGLFSEKSGVFNIGLEGLMVVGAFTTAMVVTFIGPQVGPLAMILISLTASFFIGGLFSLLLAVAAVNLRANQIIAGTALNMFALAFTIFIVKLIFKGEAEIPSATVGYMHILNIGSTPFQVNISFALALIITIASSFLFLKTKLGLRLKAVGENPSAVDAAGISVSKLRYFGVFVSGCFAGLGGSLVSLSFSNGSFSTLTIAGLGFLSLASLVFGKWKPWGVFAAAVFFGFSKNMAATAISNFPSITGIIPPVILKITPYLITIIALIIFSRSAAAPKAAGKIYDKGER